MDRLTPLFDHVALRAGVFHAGKLCGVHDVPGESLRGHLHLIRQGPVRVIGVRREEFEIVAPTLLLLPRPELHQLVTDERAGADIVCGAIQFGQGGSNPLSDSLPDILLVELRDLPAARAILDAIFGEAFEQQSGRQAMLDRLCEVLMIHVLRYCLEKGITRGGVLAAMADPKLARVVLAIQADPAREWSLNQMSELAGMSRARFALHFRKVTGTTPAAHLAAWRVATAQKLLRSGRSLQHVAHDVGYGSPSALIRSFRRQLGETPGRWTRK